MGIRGAWSLLSSDLRRFGARWIASCDDEPETHVIFLDGPSLLYHVAASDVYDRFPSLQVNSSSRFKQTCPATIYHRITVFISSLMEVCPGAAIHIVLDGLADPAKFATQITRLSQVAKACDYKAKYQSKSTRHNILHILAETAMIDALEDKIMHSDRLYLHRPSHGEAEMYIHQWLKQNNVVLPLARISILSNDTDFLVYYSCPGFVPFTTLSFHLVDGKLCLSGFEYHRSRFIAAFIPCIKEDKVLTMEVLTLTAALAGCDYRPSVPSLESALEEAGRIIAKSDIGGLRQRERNDPSAAPMLTSVLRYVAHFVRQSKSKGQSDWKEAMIARLFPEREQRSQLRLALQQIHYVYASTAQETGRLNNGTCLTEAYRLLQCGALICRPVIETWHHQSSRDDTIFSPEWAPVTSRKRSQRKQRRGKKKKTNSQAAFATEHKEVLVTPEDDQLHFTRLQVPPACETVEEWLASGSVWALPHLCQVRCRLYSMVHHFLKCGQKLPLNDGNNLNEVWRSSYPSVTEYRRVGRGQGVYFEAIEIPVFSRTSGFWGDGASHEPNIPASSSSLSMILACITGNICHKRIDDDIQGAVQRHWPLVATSLLLPSKLALSLLLLGSAPSRIKVLDRDVSLSLSSTVNSALCVSAVAWYHTMLVEHTLCTVAGLPLICHESRVSDIFRSDIAGWIFDAVQQSGVGAVESNGITIPMVQSCFQLLAKAKFEDGQSAELQGELEEWMDSTQNMVKTWQQFFMLRRDCLD